MTERAENIERRLTEHLTEIGSIPVVKAASLWATDADTLHTPFGYSRPVWLNYRSYVPFCPELIDRTTAHLDDTDLTDYLTCVIFQLDYYIAHKDMGDDESSQWFDRYVSEEFIGSLALMNEVQMNWLDRKAST